MPLSLTHSKGLQLSFSTVSKVKKEIACYFWIAEVQ